MDQPRIGDGEMIAASLGDPRAFGVIFERHFGAIHGYLRRRLDRQLADELASQTFLVAFDRRAGFDSRRGDSRPWLFGIATNLLRNQRRRELRELRAIRELRPEPGAGLDGVEGRVDAERLRAPLAAALAELPAEEADVLLLLVWAELDQPEIAEALGIPAGRQGYAIRTLRGGGGIEFIFNPASAEMLAERSFLTAPGKGPYEKGLPAGQTIRETAFLETGVVDSRRETLAEAEAGKPVATTGPSYGG